ncbi:Sulfotransferase family protein [Komagataeibacter saccharivorans]|uniref:Sulfotransferase family protein n=1 Tax=Komagataeibacter saccharivorans TaxID=265959 RepID=A0A347WC93_9PROT|nr:sulfotransferase family 2 domain-containing protein [Komagataeibacter saccharivorans]AXY22486.1 Sulfotransferase family protein [Komagataeibacter saccharivorans]
MNKNSLSLNNKNVHSLLTEIQDRPGGNLSLDEHFLKTPRDDVFFLFLEKVGCTTLKHLLIQTLWGDISSIDAEYYMDGWTERNLIHAISFELFVVNGRDVLNKQNAKIITFCRNPYERFVSAYVDKIVNTPKQEVDFFKWVKREILFKKLRENFGNKKITESLSEVSMKDFAEFVKCTPEEYRDKHWISQHALNLADIIEISEIIRLEDFNQKIPEMWKRLFGVEINMKSNICDNKVKRKKCYLNEEIASLIYEIYEKDFKLFGYEKESWRGL